MLISKIGSYKGNSLAIRDDGDGKSSVYVTADASATALYPQVVFVSYDGYHSKALFATSYASVGAGSLSLAFAQKLYIGVPNTNIPSGSDGWMQIKGPFLGMGLAATVSIPAAGYAFTWVGSAVSVTSTVTTGGTYGGSIFALSLSTGSTSAYDAYLVGNPVLGIG